MPRDSHSHTVRSRTVTGSRVCGLDCRAGPCAARLGHGGPSGITQQPRRIDKGTQERRKKEHLEGLLAAANANVAVLHPTSDLYMRLAKLEIISNIYTTFARGT
jgi:hypothetical protein